MNIFKTTHERDAFFIMLAAAGFAGITLARRHEAPALMLSAFVALSLLLAFTSLYVYATGAKADEDSTDDTALFDHDSGASLYKCAAHDCYEFIFRNKHTIGRPRKFCCDSCATTFYKRKATHVKKRRTKISKGSK